MGGRARGWAGKGGADFHLEGGQEDGIAMKGAQSKVKWKWGSHDVKGEGHDPQAPHSYATAQGRLYSNRVYTRGCQTSIKTK